MAPERQSAERERIEQLEKAVAAWKKAQAEYELAQSLLTSKVQAVTEAREAVKAAQQVRKPKPAKPARKAAA